MDADIVFIHIVTVKNSIVLNAHTSLMNTNVSYKLFLV
jgi:hypothetical protein